MSLSREKEIIINEILAGKNIFITGSAGTGKSYLLKHIKDRFTEIGLHVTASTGIAAVHIGGTTLHSWACLGLGTSPAEEIANFINSGKGTRIRRKLKKAKMLAIDEISMISAETFDLLNEVLKIIRYNKRPFGGIQLILFGDFLQLPPVNKRQDYNFCFESDAWREATMEVHCLREVYRQQDIKFVNLLDNIRFGRINNQDLEILNNRRIKDDNSLIKPTIIGTHNYQIDTINKNELAKLKGPEHLFTMRSTGNPDRITFLKKNCLASENLVLKLGAQVMMLKNTLSKQGVINGSLGVITEFNAANQPVVAFNNGKVITIEAEQWITEEFNQETLEMEVKATVNQIPLMLAWAITVHKSQGMTLDKIQCDLGQAFEEGQVYVAISRVKTLEGLYLKSFNPKYIRANPKVIEFYQKFENIDA